MRNPKNKVQKQHKKHFSPPVWFSLFAAISCICKLTWFWVAWEAKTGAGALWNAWDKVQNHPKNWAFQILNLCLSCRRSCKIWLWSCNSRLWRCNSRLWRCNSRLWSCRLRAERICRRVAFKCRVPWILFLAVEIWHFSNWFLYFYSSANKISSRK